VALLARALSGGFAAAWPLALGVTLGDFLWPALAIFGMGWVLSVYGEALQILRWIAAATFAVMGALLIAKSGTLMSADSKMTRPGRLAGLMTGVAAVVGNPKAFLFYMTVLPAYLGRIRRRALGGQPWPCAVFRPRARPFVEPRACADAEPNFWRPADPCGLRYSLGLTAKYCVEGVTIPSKDSINCVVTQGCTAHG
jgi:hypothetical protein